MATRKRSLAFTNFKGGEWGLLGGENAPAGSFSGKNVIVYADGLIGPRAGLKNITPENMVSGKLIAFAPTPTPGRDGIFIIGETAYRFNLFDPAGDTPVSVGTVPNAAGHVLYPKLNTSTNIVTAATEGAVEINQITDSVNSYFSPSGHTHELFGFQLVLADSTSSPRIYASAIGDFTDWSDGFFQDIGDNDWQVTAMVTQNNYLTIFKRTGIFVLTGELTNDSTSLAIRRVKGINGVLHPWQLGVDSRDVVWFLPLFKAVPASFAGATVTEYSHLQFPTRVEDGTTQAPPVNRGVAILQGQLTPDTPVFVQGGASQSMFIQHNGVWSFHELEVDISGMCRGVENNLVITDGGDTGVDAQFYTTHFDLDRPAFTSDGLSSPGDGSSTPIEAEFELPYFLNPAGNFVRVRSVSVEVKKWNTGVTTNGLDITVTTLNRTNGAGDYVNPTASWTEAATAATVDGVHDRIVRPLHCALGQGFKIKISNIVGVAIRSVSVDIEEDTNLPRDDNG